MAGMVDVLVTNRIDVSAAALDKQSNRVVAEIVLNDLRRESRNVSGYTN